MVPLTGRVALFLSAGLILAVVLGLLP